MSQPDIVPIDGRPEGGELALPPDDSSLHPIPLNWMELYESLGERVFRLLHRMTGDAALAEDLVHETFLRVHQAQGRFEGRGDLAAWVYRIAGNLGRDELRSREMRSRRLLLFPEPTPPGPDHELRVVLERALDTLDEGHREVVLLHDVDGYTHNEIAEMLGIREGTSRARLSRARASLRETLGPDFQRE
jgi:RNA polymerase sigma-70 factor (ECF subfamily)